MAPSKSNWLPFKNEAVQSFSFLPKKLRYLNWKFWTLVTTSGKVFPKRLWETEPISSPSKGPPHNSSWGMNWKTMYAQSPNPATTRMRTTQRTHFLLSLRFVGEGGMSNFSTHLSNLLIYNFFLAIYFHVHSHMCTCTHSLWKENKLTVPVTRQPYPTATDSRQGWRPQSETRPLLGSRECVGETEASSLHVYVIHTNAKCRSCVTM